MRYLLPLWLASIVGLSMIPLELKNKLGTTGVLHSWGHFFIFVITAIFLSWNVSTLSQRTYRFVGAVVFGFGLEWLERAVYGNRLEWHDVFIDGLGALFGFIVTMSLPLLSPAERRT